MFNTDKPKLINGSYLHKTNYFCINLVIIQKKINNEN